MPFCVNAVAVDVYNQTVDGEVASTVTAAAGGGQTQVGQRSSCTLKIRGGGATRMFTARKLARER